MPGGNRIPVKIGRRIRFRVPIMPTRTAEYPLKRRVRNKVVYVTRTGALIRPIEPRVYGVHEVMNSEFTLREERVGGCEFLYAGKKVYARIGPKQFVLVKKDYREWPH